MKLIYIDPPYNTGTDFVYPDNYRDSIRNYMEVTGQRGDEGELLNSENETGGRRHTDWLNMIYPRLTVAAEFLSGDGIILISIADEEISNMLQVASEIFGEERRAAIIHRRKNRKPHNAGETMSFSYEFIVAFYARESFKMIQEYSIGHVDAKGVYAIYPVIQGDKKERTYLFRAGIPVGAGAWRKGVIEAQRNSNLNIEILDHPEVEDGVLRNDVRIKGRFRLTNESGALDAAMAAGNIFINSAGFPKEKRYRSDEDAKVDNHHWDIDKGRNEDGDDEIKRLFDLKADNNLFKYPKPVALLRKAIVSTSTGDGDIVMDFFAGSGSTGHAVMAQNAEDGARRRFVLVQLPEQLEKSAKAQADAAALCDRMKVPSNIAELTKERLRRAGKAVRRDAKGSVDTGFRVYRLATSNLKPWQPDPDNLEASITASPQWWEKATLDEKAEWWRAQLRFANDLFGPGLIAFTPHVDESTPHAQFVGLPLYHDIVRKRGAKPTTPEAKKKRAEEEARSPKIRRLSHDRVFGGSPERLAKLQTTYHTYVKDLGLARGRDTVGVGIKHTTLKHYKKLLTQMDRDLAREAAEQREERQVLDHYDAELRKKYEQFRKDELALFGREEECRVREERLDLRQGELEAWTATLDARQAALNQRKRDLEEAAAVREKRLGEAEVRLGEGQRQVATDRERVQDRNREADDRETVLATRELAVGVQERALRVEEARQKSIAAQLSIVGGLFVGRLSGGWDRDRQRPQIANGELAKAEKEALLQAWPDWLRVAVKRAAEMATIRSTIARQVRRIIAALRRKRQAARLALAAANDRVTEALEKEARAERIMDTARRDEIAIARAANAAASRVTQAQGEAARAETARDAAVKQTNETLRTCARVEEETVLLRNEVTALRSEQSSVATNVTTLQEERRTLERDLTLLRSEKRDLENDRRQLERDRQAHAQAAKRLDRSRALVSDLFTDKVSIDVDSGSLRISAGPAAPYRQPMHLAGTQVEPWVETIVKQHSGLVAALARAEEVEASLKDARVALAVRYPDRAEELRDEQAAETKAIDERLVRQPPAMDGIGM